MAIVIMNRNRSWLRFKGYTHFTPKLNKEDIPFIIGYVRNPKSIKTHKFYPLIHREINTRRYKLGYDSLLQDRVRAHFHFDVNGKKKSTMKTRKIYYSSHLDSVIYSYYSSEILSRIYEKRLSQNKGLSDCIIAYRKIKKEGEDRNKNNIDFAKDVFDEIKRQIRLYKKCVVIAFDITEFFDSLNHSLLKKEWVNLLRFRDKSVVELPEDHYQVFKSLTNFSYVNINDILKEFNIPHIKELYRKQIVSFTSGHSDFKTRIAKNGYIKKHPFKCRYNPTIRAGIPQGTPISAFLANLYLSDFDERVYNEVSSIDGYYRRYSDDLIVVCKEENSDYIKTFVENIIAKDYLLEIQSGKTQISLFKKKYKSGICCYDKIENKIKPFSYLGFEFDGQNARIKSASLSKFYRAMKRLIKIKAKRASIDLKQNYNSRTHRKVGDIWVGPIYQRFSHKGKRGRKRNYYLYAKDAVEIMNDEAISRQLSKSWNNLHKYLNAEIRKYNLPTN